MEAIIDSWKSSGKSLLAFSKTSDIPYSRLCYWNRRLNSVVVKRCPKAKSESVLVPGKVVPEHRAQPSFNSDVATMLENGIRMAVQDSFNAHEVRRLIEALRPC